MTTKFTFHHLIDLYNDYSTRYQHETYKHVSSILQEAKHLHKEYFFRSDAVQTRLGKGETVDHEQSWRAFKGKNLEKLIEHLIKEECQKLGVTVINGNRLERSKHLTPELQQVKDNLTITYQNGDTHLPDVDLVAYDPQTLRVLCVLSSKVTLRERVSQTAYWKMKFLQSPQTSHINVFFVTLDEDGTLTHRFPAKKGRTIVENELDGTYVLTTSPVETSDTIHLFPSLMKDIHRLKNENITIHTSAPV